MDGISVQEAASQFGVSERTIRRRIKAGQLKATRAPTSQGYEWRIHLNNAVQVDSSAAQVDSSAAHTEQPATLIEESAVLRALELVEKLQRENLELAGRVGFYQAKLQDAQEKIQLLSAPKDSEKPKKPWWRRFTQK